MKARFAFAGRRRSTGVKAGLIRFGLVAGLIAAVAGPAAPGATGVVLAGPGGDGTGCCIGPA